MTFLRGMTRDGGGGDVSAGNDGGWVPASVDSRPRLRGGRLFAGMTGWCAGVTRGGLGPCGFLALWIPAPAFAGAGSSRE